MSPLRIEFHHPVEPADACDPSLRRDHLHHLHRRHPPSPRRRWVGGRAVVEADDPAVKASIERAFRATPVVVDDPSLRDGGIPRRADAPARKHRVVPCRSRSSGSSDETGLAARSVPGVTVGGYDPAANYRRFSDQIERLES